MKIKKVETTFLLFLAVQPLLHADECFFRIAGPVPTTITACGADGYVTWTNTATNATFTIQVAKSLIGPSNWADYIKVPATNSITGLRLFDPNPPTGMVLVPAGSFLMGNCMATNDGFSDELPLHTVVVDAIYTDEYEITKALWDSVHQWAISNGYSFDSAGSAKANDHPVHYVNWYDAVKWCNARSQKEGLIPAYYTEAAHTNVYRVGQMDLSNVCVNWNAGFRLPTEAEWEKAARGGSSGHRFPWSDVDTINQSRANYYSYWKDGVPYYSYDVNATDGYHPSFSSGDYPYTNPVGYFEANGYRLYDMAGNVWEWCWDWYDSHWYGNAGATQDDTRGPNGPSSYRVLRSGAWDGDAYDSRCARRSANVPTWAYQYFGFRCVRSP